MTTIAYHHEDCQIAVDSRATSGGVITNDFMVKMIKLKGCMWVLAGIPAEFSDFIDAFNKKDMENEFNCGGFMIKDGVVYIITQDDDNKFHKHEMNYTPSKKLHR